MTQSPGTSSTREPEPEALAAERHDVPPTDLEAVSPPPPHTPAQAFDALYASCAPALLRQTYLLTGRRDLARESVVRAFQLAWQRWPEVAVDRDPTGWVRAAAHEYALSPWHRLRPRLRRPEPPLSPEVPGSPQQEDVPTLTDPAVIDVLLELPPPYRRTLLLHDGVGLGLPETAAETEASTRAAAGRLMYAREVLAEGLPQHATPEEPHRRLAAAASDERLRFVRPEAPAVVRADSERRARRWTHAAIAFSVLLVTTTALTLRTAPDHYEPPVAPGAPVRDLPPRPAPGPLSQQRLNPPTNLRSEPASGPERLFPGIP